jgi:hypothetical protein
MRNKYKIFIIEKACYFYEDSIYFYNKINLSKTNHKFYKVLFLKNIINIRSLYSEIEIIIKIITLKFFLIIVMELICMSYTIYNTKIKDLIYDYYK